VVENQRTADKEFTEDDLRSFSRSITNDEKRWQVPEKGEKFDVENEIDEIVSDSFDAFEAQYKQYLEIMSDEKLAKYRPDAERWLEIGAEAYESETRLKSGIAENVFASLDNDGRKSFRDATVKSPEQQAEYTQRFLEAFKAMWKDRVATHRIGDDEKTTLSDLDGNASLFLLQNIAKLDIGKKDKIDYIPQGTYSEGKINIDTGNKDAVGTNLYELTKDSTQKETGFIDHHGIESNKDTSATLWVYEIIKEMNLIKKEGIQVTAGKEKFIATPEDIEKFVELVTQNDNKDFPDMDRYYENYPESYKTMIGLMNYISATPEYLLKFIHDGGDLYKELTYEDIKKYNLARNYYPRGRDKSNAEWTNYRNVAQNKIEKSLETVKEKMGDAKGFGLESEDFGRIFVDLSQKPEGRDDAAKSLGFDAYILWNYDKDKKESGFLISTKKGLPFDFELSEGKKVRGRMITKKGNEWTSDLTLRDILMKMGVKEADFTGELKDYLNTGDISRTETVAEPVAEPEELTPEPKTDHAEVAAKLDAERREALKSKKIEVQGVISDNPDEFVDAIKYYESVGKFEEREKSRVIIERDGNFWKVISTMSNPVDKQTYIFFREYDPIADQLVGEGVSVDQENMKAANTTWYRGPERGVVAPPVAPAVVAEPVVVPVVTEIIPEIIPEEVKVPEILDSVDDLDEKTLEIDLKLLKAGDLIEPVINNSSIVGYKINNSSIVGYKINDANIKAVDLNTIKVSYLNTYSIDDPIPTMTDMIRVKVTKKAVSGIAPSVFVAMSADQLSVVFRLVTPRNRTEDDVHEVAPVVDETDALEEYFAPLLVDEKTDAAEAEKKNDSEYYTLEKNAVGDDWFVFDIFENQGGPLKIEVGQKWTMFDGTDGQDEITSVDYLHNRKNTAEGKINPNIDSLLVKFKLANGQSYSYQASISEAMGVFELAPESRIYQDQFQGKEVTMPEEDTNG